jgi:energy-coupling factor transport system ATP-binding protein
VPRLVQESGFNHAVHAVPASETGPSKAEHPDARLLEQSSETVVWLRMDPRAKWLLYLLTVAGTMLQQDGIGLLAVALVTAFAFTGLPRSVIRGGIKAAKPVAVFSLVAIALAGIQISAAGHTAVGFSFAQASASGLNVARLFIVTVASYWLAATTPYGRMVQGLNWALKHGEKLKLPVSSFALAVSLIFRFIPLILREWQRFSAIVRARGKASLRPGAVRFRDIPALVVPLLLSLFYKAEEMTMAMELKKIGERKPTAPTDTLHWSGTETAFVVAGIAVFGILFYLRG